MKTAVYPGSFDPLTNGHLDIIIRGSRLVDKLIIAVVDNPNKDCSFSLLQRKAMIEDVIRNINLNAVVKEFSGLVVDFLKQIDVDIIIRGIRALSDFEFEFRSARMNNHLSPSVETIFLLSSPEYEHISSSLIKEVFYFGGDVSHYLPKAILDKMTEANKLDDIL